MAKLKEEILNLILNVKGDNARKEINDTINAISDGKAKVKEMKAEMRDLAKQGQTNSARYKDLAKAVKDESTALDRNSCDLLSDLVPFTIRQQSLQLWQRNTRLIRLSSLPEIPISLLP